MFVHDEQTFTKYKCLSCNLGIPSTTAGLIMNTGECWHTWCAKKEMPNDIPISKEIIGYDYLNEDMKKNVREELGEDMPTDGHVHFWAVKEGEEDAVGRLPVLVEFFP